MVCVTVRLGVFEGVLVTEAVTDGVVERVLVFDAVTVSVWTAVTDGLGVFDGVRLGV